MKLENPNEKNRRLFKEYMRNKRIMIVDSQAYSRAALTQTLIELGATLAQITLAPSFRAAEAEIAKGCPDILLSEFDLEGGACGLDLLAAQRKLNKQSRRSLFILVTSNTS